MKNLFNRINAIIYKKKYYEIFFENPTEEYLGPNFEMLARIFFGFSFLKLLDMTLKPTKDKVLEKSKENEELYNIATYENREPTGFYNASEYDISKIQNTNDSYNALLDYIDGFSDNIKEIYEKMKFKKCLEFLVRYNVLDDYLEVIYDNPDNKMLIADYEELVSLIKYLIHFMGDDEYYLIGFEYIINDDPFSSYYYIQDSLNEYGELLNKLLLYDTYIENKDIFKIYDANSSGAYILEKTKRELLKDFPNSKIELYGKCERKENEIIHLIKNAVTKKDSYAPADAVIIDPKESIFEVSNTDSYEDFDLIISNYVGCDESEDEEILKCFQNPNLKKTKVVLAIDSLKKVKKYLGKIISNDYLEAVIHFKTHFILILNTNKSEDKKEKFIIIDESEIDDGDEYKIQFKKDTFTNEDTSIYHLSSLMTFSEFDLKQINNIFESYKKFKTTDDAILIENRDYGDEVVEVLLR